MESGDASAAASAARFLDTTSEDGDLNQYWYSAHTIDVLVSAIQRRAGASGRVAFVSTPSLFFSLTDDALRARSTLLDYDKQWAALPNFVHFDYRAPDAVPTSLHGQYDLVVVDPPFVTRDAWELYTVTVKRLLRPGSGHVLLTTLGENAPMMHELLGVRPVRFQPSIPHLVYQYTTYATFDDDEALAARNPEIPED